MTFNTAMLQKAVEEQLTKNDLYGADSNARIQIDVKRVNLRSQGAAVMLGFLAGSDSLVGSVTLLDSNGNMINKFDIDASYAAGGFIGGLNTTRMEWLYGKFAELTATTIKG